MDHSRLLVWMENRAEAEREMTGKLCTRHADALVMPRGWTIEDRRTPVPLLFSPRQLVDTSDPALRPARDSTTTRMRRPKVTATGDSLFDVATPGGDAGEHGADGAVPASVRNGSTDVPAVRPDGDLADDAGEPGSSGDAEETRAMPWTPRLAAAAASPAPEDVPRMGRLLGRAYGIRKGNEGDR